MVETETVVVVEVLVVELAAVVVLVVLVLLAVLLELVLVLVALDVVDEVVLVLVALEVVEVVVTWLPGRHCEYQSFWYTQTLPDVQQVAPDHPMPPHWTLKRPVNRVLIPGRRVSGNLPAATAALALLDNGGGEGGSRKRGSKEKLRSHCRNQTTQAGDGADVGC